MERAWIRSKAVWLVCAVAVLGTLGWLSLHRLPGAVMAGPRARRTTAPVLASRVEAAYGKLPISFEKNEGQSNPQVKYLAHGQGYTLFLAKGEAVLSLTGRAGGRVAGRHGGRTAKGSRGPGPTESAMLGRKGERDQVRTSLVRLKFVGANPRAKVVALDELPGKSNYFIGNDRSDWRTNVPNYAEVEYLNVYPGIDLMYHGNQQQLELDLIAAPGADPDQVRLTISGAGGPQLSPAGDLVIHARSGDVSLLKPVVYQVTREGRLAVSGRYVLSGRHEVAFDLGPYDRSKALVIDPTLAYSTYLGGSASEAGNAIAVDSSGDAYVAGCTVSSNFPTTSPYQTSGVGFVAKLNPSGNGLVYSSYFGTVPSANESGSSCSFVFNGLYVAGIAVDGSGDAYLTGKVNFQEIPGTFPTVNQIASACDSSCVTNGGGFVAKLNANGSALVYSSLIADADAKDIAVDSAGNAYVTGTVFCGGGFPVLNAVQPACGGPQDAFLLKVNSAGSALVYSTYLGGSSTDVGNAVAVDSSGDAYVGGYTFSPDFPVVNQIPGACVGTCGTGETGTAASTDAFVTKFNAAGSALVYSTLVGGSWSDFLGPVNNGGDSGGLALDSADNVYITGESQFAPGFGFPTTNDFPTTTGAFETSCTNAGSCGFVTKINAGGTALMYSTFLGQATNATNSPFDLAVDASGDAAVVGEIYVPLVNPIGSQTGNAAVAVLNPAGSALLLSTTLGSGECSSFSTCPERVTFDGSGNVYVVGQTTDGSFPTTTGAFQTTYNGAINGASGYGDAFVSKISLAGGSAPAVSLSAASLNLGSEPVGTTSPAQSVTVTNSGNANLTFAAGAVTISGTNQADFKVSADSCSGQTVTAGNTCSVSVTFTPSVASSESATLNFADNAANSPQTVSLSGTGTTPEPTAAVAPTSLTFGSQAQGTTSAAQTVTLSNSGNASLSIASITASANFSESDNCGSSLGAGNNCAISVTLAPTTTGTLTGTLTVTDNSNGTANSTQTVSLSGTGTAPPDFAIAVASGGASSATVSPGGTASYTLSVTPQNGFNQAVSLTCSGAPSEATCSVSPTSVTPSGTTTSAATVTVVTTAASNLPPSGPAWPVSKGPGVWLLVPGLLLLLALARELRRRQFGDTARLAWRRRIVLAGILLAVATMAACGGGSNKSSNPGTPAGTYTVTVTGTSGSLSHSTSLSLTVN